MEPRKDFERILAVSIALLVAFLLFEMYWFLTIPAAIVLLGIFSEKFTTIIVGAFRKTGSLISGVMTKIILSLLFLLILLPIAITQGLISKF
jgi:hypothetical protein